MLLKVNHCAGCVLAKFRCHQLELTFSFLLQPLPMYMWYSQPLRMYMWYSQPLRMYKWYSQPLLYTCGIPNHCYIHVVFPTIAYVHVYSQPLPTCDHFHSSVLSCSLSNHEIYVSGPCSEVL